MIRTMRKLIHRLSTNVLAFIGCLVVLAAILTALFAPVLAPHDPTEMHTSIRFAPPGTPGYPLGTDQFGRDVLSRIIYGSRVSLPIASMAVLLAALLGGQTGLIAGFLGGWPDTILMRVVDVMCAIPTMLIALGVVALMGPSAVAVMIALGVANAPLFARVVRSAVVGVRNQGYVEAAQAMGASSGRILRQDVAPNILPIFVVQATAATAWSILDEASLGFLGLGVQPPTPSWGSLLTEGRQFFYLSPTMALFAGLAVLIIVFGLNLFGDGLRDLLDPRAWQAAE